ncbi:MAG TPA: hypothetical protein VNZ24_10315, partial [Vicinamibacterales bacterium]|nr:hypothetical protein [Vicinamibacterales bacterium]
NRHGSPRFARHASSHTGIESLERPKRFRIPAWLDLDAGNCRRDPWHPAISATLRLIQFFVSFVQTKLRG